MIQFEVDGGSCQFCCFVLCVFLSLPLPVVGTIRKGNVVGVFITNGTSSGTAGGQPTSSSVHSQPNTRENLVFVNNFITIMDTLL